MHGLSRPKRHTVTFWRFTFPRAARKGERSCPLPLEMLSHFSPLSPICACGRGKGISRSAERDQGLCPVDLATFEKVDETFPWRLRRLKDR